VNLPGSGLKPVPGGGWGFWLPGAELEPAEDLAWQKAPAAVRKAFWEEAAHYASRVWKRHRAEGLDRTGQALAAIHPLTVQARTADVNPVTGRQPYSPMGRASAGWAPLQATGGASRLQSLLRWKPVAGQGVWFYWAFDRHTRHYWGEILARHARGFAQRFVYPSHGWGHVPGRDVFGFSDAELKLIREWMAGWWMKRRVAVVAKLAEGSLKAGPKTVRVETRGLGVRPGAARFPERNRRVVVRGIQTLDEMMPGSGIPEGARSLGRSEWGQFRVARPKTVKPRTVKPPPLRVREVVDYAKKQTPRPRPVSAALTLVSGHAQQARIEKAIALVDQVHTDGRLDRIKIVRTRLAGLAGSLDVRRNGRPWRMRIREKSPTPILTTLHEVGHLLDVQGIPGGVAERGKQGRDWLADPLWRAWVEAVNRSRAARELARLVEQQRAEGADVETIRKLERLLRADEFWARGYAQYIVEQTGDAEAAAELARVTRRPTDPYELYVPEHWDYDDFKPIATAIEALIRALGWRLP
jgi:hypothetical protein